jgi:hypothetical protein
LRDRSICDPIYSFGATFALSPRVRGERRREGTLFRHLKNFVSHPGSKKVPFFACFFRQFCQVTCMGLGDLTVRSGSSGNKQAFEGHLKRSETTIHRCHL